MGTDYICGLILPARSKSLRGFGEVR